MYAYSHTIAHMNTYTQLHTPLRNAYRDLDMVLRCTLDIQTDVFIQDTIAQLMGINIIRNRNNKSTRTSEMFQGEHCEIFRLCTVNMYFSRLADSWAGRIGLVSLRQRERWDEEGWSQRRSQMSMPVLR